ncbi:MAG: MFS transporter, partial [Phenylobacterium sp.]|nr:MFS transporter [Phenylobacterium sp.]
MATIQNALATGEKGEAWPSRPYAWFVVIVLLLAYTSSFVDRQILTLLVEPIRADLKITDTQFSLLTGLAFSATYTIAGFPFAWLADRFSRRGVIIAGITAWSIMTAGCGLARNFGGLFLTRMGVGIGEATLSPAAYSLIADYFPLSRRATAMAVYSIGVFIGAGAALIVGGQVIAAVSQGPPLSLPVVGRLAPWQVAFLYVAAPGPLIALLMLLVREPLRRGIAKSSSAEKIVPYIFARW